MKKKVESKTQDEKKMSGSGLEFAERDLSHAICDLSSGRYSHREVAEDTLRVLGNDRKQHAGRLDGEEAHIRTMPHNEAWAVAPWVNVSARTDKTNIFMPVVEGSPSLNEFRRRFRLILSTETYFGRYFSTEQDMGALFRAASGQRVAYVELIVVREPEWSELPIRLVHATIAYLAEIGVISGACLVVLDKRSYMYGNQTDPLALERGLRASRYNFERIGNYLLVARAHDMLTDVERVYRHVRDAQIGMRSRRVHTSR
jgi:hypothetical protein